VLRHTGKKKIPVEKIRFIEDIPGRDIDSLTTELKNSLRGGGIYKGKQKVRDFVRQDSR
jgi:hypothetical protein